MADYVNQSLYPQPVNPLTNLSNVTGIANAVTANKLRQQELQSQTGLMQLYAGAPKDANGNIDQNYIQQNASKAGIHAPEIVQAAQGAQLTAQQIQQAVITTQKARSSMTAAALMPLVNNPKATVDDYVHAANNLVQNSKGLITSADIQPTYDALATTLAQGGNVSAHARELLGQQLAAGGDVAAGAKMMYGEPVNIHTGGGTQTGVQNPATGQVTQSGYIPDTLPATTPKKNNDPNSPHFGETTYVGSETPNGSQPAGGPASGAAHSPLAGAFKPPGGASPAPGSTVAELSPGAQAMLGDAGKAAQARVDSTIQDAKDARVSQDVNQQVINLSKELGNNVGPVSTKVTSILGQLADTPGLGPVLKAVSEKNPSDTAGQLMELQKYLLRSAQMRGAALGLGGTDYQTGLLQHANPNDAQFPATIQKLAKYNQALDMLQQGKANALDKFPGAKTSPVANQDFENQMRNAANINVYRTMLASPEERKEIYKNMSSEDKHQMVSDRQKLQQLGAIPSQLQSSFKTYLPPAQGTTQTVQGQ